MKAGDLLWSKTDLLADALVTPILIVDVSRFNDIVLLNLDSAEVLQIDGGTLLALITSNMLRLDES